jgi:CRP-like cAMP-binding protein/rhodanese-related sulfurtransferase
MMANESGKEEFNESKVFGELPREKWDELVRVVEHRVVGPGTVIVKQEDPGNSFFIIRSGKVRAYRRDNVGLEMELSVLGAGESFGEMALLTGQERSANVEALEETHLMVLSREQFERILRDFPHISRAFLKQMSERILRDEKIIEKEIRRQHLAPRASWLDFVMIIGVSIVLAIVFNKSNPNGIPLFPNPPDRKAIPEISAVSAMEEVKKGNTMVVDAGPEGFFQRKHIQGAISVPLSLSDLLYEETFGGEEKRKQVIVYGGTFSKLYDWELADKLIKRGRKDVRVLEGGVAAWEKAGYPVEKWEETK